ncbi:hypothetical protein sphantq_00495 [Sphingobium sp. AntQ-1]|jgi:hypothetical protein|uniref:Uncharacterized protein n=1 Tax=Edaphosphingomonas haloaromaticamans TaxID=653954 RepID=A0A1S1HI21_9SPHN|nr:hypothetical protein BHE75_03738 [Sphingomonas haloaromaticamans]WCP12098.1 hypothetical protein sphantq_00495 [Sphingobium sp. AntQ-1]
MKLKRSASPRLKRYADEIDRVQRDLYGED